MDSVGLNHEDVLEEIAVNATILLTFCLQYPYYVNKKMQELFINKLPISFKNLEKKRLFIILHSYLYYYKNINMGIPFN